MLFFQRALFLGICLVAPAVAIVNGKVASLRQFPYMASLASTKDVSVFCGAVVLNSRQVLTTARCLDSRSMDEILVFANNLYDTTGSDSISEVRRVMSRRIHSQYRPDYPGYDIAILDLVSPFSGAVQPAKLPLPNERPAAGKLAQLVGWGSTSFNGPPSPQLRYVDVSVLTNGDCRSKEPGLKPGEFCTFMDQRGGCQRDSGGPVVQQGKVFGLIEYGRFCGGLDIHIEVASFLSWISMNTRG